MPRRDIIVVGGSAGSIGTLKRLAASFPPDMKAAVFVVIHMPAWHKSELDEILTRSGPLPALFPSKVDQIKRGFIYLAPPDHHMLIGEDNAVRLTHGPRENGHRPSIDALFRSAAARYRERVIGVVLSGQLDDGAAGLWWVKRYGGLAVVADPDQAPFRSMPEAAIANVNVDFVRREEEIGKLLVQLTDEDVKTQARQT